MQVWGDVRAGHSPCFRRGALQLRAAASQSFVQYLARLALQLAGSGASSAAVDRAKQLFDSNVLTLGFARRFATYKRPTCCCMIPSACCAC